MACVSPRNHLETSRKELKRSIGRSPVSNRSTVHRRSCGLVGRYGGARERPFADLA